MIVSMVKELLISMLPNVRLTFPALNHPYNIVTVHGMIMRAEA